MNQSRVFLHAGAWIFLALLGGLPSMARAQQLPVNVSVSGNVATVQIGGAGNPLADITISFDDASGLTPASLGVSASAVNVSDPTLVARLPSASLTSIPSAFPVLITVEPPVSGGLSFHRQAHIEVHTHALSYVAGTPLRLFKAPLNGSFRDITSDVAPGSVRTRGTTGGWSQMLVVTDLRATASVIADKIAALRGLLAGISATERNPLAILLNSVENNVNSAHYANAIASLDAFRARVSNRAGTYIPDQWRATRDITNSAGELLSGADTLRYSIGFLRDYGQ
jgi:hypothetical protein